MKQQIIVSGTGGQGVLFLTRFFAEAAMEKGLDVLTSEIHGMAMRGGTVVSHVKVGPFSSPLVRSGQADVALMMNEENVEIHRSFVREGGMIYVNAPGESDAGRVDATRAAMELGSPAVTNVVLLGFAVGSGTLFCDEQVSSKIIWRLSPPGHAERNMKAFVVGLGIWSFRQASRRASAGASPA